MQKFQSPLPPRGATPKILLSLSKQTYFNPRSPHGERRLVSRIASSAFSRFQSTLPARGATRTAATRRANQRNFNPRSPHGERRVYLNSMFMHQTFQSTLPARGATGSFCQSCHVIFVFQSTLPARGATYAARQTALELLISIHAPRTGSDPNDPVDALFPDISIHAPRTGSDNPR